MVKGKKCCILKATHAIIEMESDTDSGASFGQKSKRGSENKCKMTSDDGGMNM